MDSSEYIAALTTTTLRGPRQADLIKQLESILNSSTASIRPAGTFTKATRHTPSCFTRVALSYVRTVPVESIISIGDGGTIGPGKALSLSTTLPHITIPTTYSGSEMAPAVGATNNGHKITQFNPQILPGTLIYDVDFTTSLPKSMSATSSVNAIVHATEALDARNGNPISTPLALEGIKSLAESLPEIVADPAS